MSVIEDPAHAIQYPEQDFYGLFNRVIAKELVAYDNDSSSPQNLVIGATSNVNIEAVNDINIYMKGTGDFKMFTSTYNGVSRTDTELLKVTSCNTQTVISAPTAIRLSPSDNQSTVVIADATINNAYEYNTITTTQEYGFMFNNAVSFNSNTFMKRNLTVGGKLATAGPIISSSGLFGTTVNVWKDISSAGNGAIDKIGFALNINENNQLELIKVMRYNDAALDSDKTIRTRKVALFDNKNTNSNDASDVVYSGFGGINGMSLLNAKGDWIGSYIQQAKLTASDSAISDEFGSSVALSSDGNTLAVGSWLDNTAGGADAGSVYVFTRNGINEWTEQTKLTSSLAGDSFGCSVALSSDGNTLAVGAYQNDTVGANGGAVWVFTRSGTTWSQQQKLTASNGVADDRFGVRVALLPDGNTLAVGAYTDDTARGTDAGSVYVFTRSGITWSQQQQLTATDGAANNLFGSDVAWSSDGNTLIIGAQGGSSVVGAVYVFTLNGNTWTQQQKLMASDGVTNDLFGISVAVSSDGNTIVAGANLDDYDSKSSAGSVYVFTHNGTNWNQQAKLTASDSRTGDYFGLSVALSSDGNKLAVGAYGADLNIEDIGAVYIFTRNGSAWTQQQQLTGSNAFDFENFGYSVAMTPDGETIAAGAYYGYTATSAPYCGATYVFMS